MRGIVQSAMISFAIASTAIAPSAWAADCGLKRITSIDTLAAPNGMMLVPVKIGDSDRLLLFDTGGSISGLTQPAAQELGLNSLEGNVELIGVGGAVSRRYTIIPSLTLGGLETKSLKVMILPGPGMNRDNRLAGSLAPNPTVDIDLDFAGRRLSFFSNDHCEGKVVYWPATAVAAIPMRVVDLGHIIIPVTLDGKKMDALIDTGASDTFLNLKIAQERFDIRPDSSDIQPGPRLAQNPALKTYKRRFSALSFEGVTVTNPEVVMVPDEISQRMPNRTRTGSLIADAKRGLPDIALGMSVLGKTHMYVAYKEKKVYITAATPQAEPQAAPQ